MKILRRNSSLLQIAVVAVAIMLTALVGYQIKHTTDYAETATVVFTVEHSSAQVNASFRVVESLTTTGEVMVQTLMSQDSHTTARRDGGTAAFNAEIINYFNEDFPEYGYPFATLAVQGPALEGVQTTFKVVIHMLDDMLSSKQAQADVPKAQRITISVLDDTGPFLEKPSRERSYAALCLLSVLGTSTSLIFVRRLLPRRDAGSLGGGRHAASGRGAAGSCLAR